MALNAAQMAARAGKLTASRIGALMTGDAVQIDRLYRELIGEEQPENLDNIWAVRLGEATEAINLEWFERKNYPLTRHGEVVTHPSLPWAAATLDAWCEQLQCPVEAKHVGGREPLEIIFERYAPQTQWLMECTGANQCAISVIMGASEPVVDFLERDAEYAAEAIRRGAQFMAFVERRIPPVVALPPVPAPTIADKSINMTGNNAWTSSAVTWRDTWRAARDHEDSGKILKSLVPQDAKKAFGAGVAITRNRVGNLSLREMKE